MATFALDQNFPEPIVVALRTSLDPVANLMPVHNMNPAYAELEDWQLLLQLDRQHGDIVGLITTDANMLSQSREMLALAQTQLTLVVTQAAGHDPILATGLLFVYLDRICHQRAANRPQVWLLAAGPRTPQLPRHFLGKIAKRNQCIIEELRAKFPFE